MTRPFRSLVLGGLALVVVAVSVIVLSLRLGDARGSVHPVPAADRDGALRESLAAVGEEAQAPPERAAVGSTRAAAELAEALWIEGRVAFPEGTPPGERVEVVAFGREFRHAPAHRAVASPDGRFRVAVPHRATTARLELSAPHVYLESSPRISLDPLPDDLVLEPLLGGRILGRLLLPPDAEERAKDLVGASVKVTAFAQTSPRSWTSTFDRTVSVTEDLTFEVGGLPADARYDIELDPGSFVPIHDSLSVAPGRDTRKELRLTLGARVSGRVVRSDGTPVPGTEVTAQTDHWSPDREARTDGEGRFDVQGIGAGNVLVTATEEGALPASWGPHGMLDGEHETGVEIVLGSGVAIAGVVRFPDGSPARGAYVAVSPSPSALDDLDYSVTAPDPVRADSQGRFEVAGSGDGPFAVHAWTIRLEKVDGGGRPKRKRVKWIANDEVPSGARDLVLMLSRGLALSGRVVDDRGAPVTTFEIDVSPVPARDGAWLHGNDGASCSVSGSDDGSFAVEGLSPGQWQVLVAHRGHVDSRPVIVQLPSAGPVTLVLRRPASVSGTVVDPSGSPVADALVSLAVSDASWSEGGWSGEDDTRTANDGSFELEDVAPGVVRVVASATGYAGARQLIAVEPAGRIEHLRLVLSAGGTITGEVDGAAGTVAGLEVRVDGPGTEHLRVTTDDRGHFRADHLSPGEHHLSVDLTPEQEARLAELNEGDDEAAWEALLALRLWKAVVVEEGRVVHVVLGGSALDAVRLFGRILAGGRPVVGAILWARPAGGGFLMGSGGRGTSGPDGTYQLDLDLPGRYAFHVWMGGQIAVVDAFVPDVPDHRLDVELAVGTIRGRVLDPDGEPVPGIGVQAYRGSGPIDLQRVAGAGFTETDEAGRYAFDALLAGRWTVQGGVTHPFLWEEEEASESPYGAVECSDVRVEPDETVELDLLLPLGGSVTGRVLDADGAAVPGALVYVRRDDGQLVRATPVAQAGADGGFTVTGLHPGRVSVLAVAAYAASRTSREVDVRGGIEARVDLVLEPGTLVLVRVLGPMGEPLDASLAVLDGSGAGFPAKDAMPLEDRRYVGPLPPGSYTIRGTTRDGAVAEAQVSVAGEPERSVELSFGD